MPAPRVECKAALLVNPYDTEAVAAAIERALSMPLEERRERHAALYEALTRNDIKDWADKFLTALTRPPNQATWLRQVGVSA